MASKKIRILNLSSMFAPFQIELAKALRAKGADYHIAFSSFSGEGRGKHWTQESAQGLDYVHCYSGWSTRRELGGHFEQLATELNPDVIIVGGLGRTAVYRASKNLLRSFKGIVTFWAEAPNRTRSFAVRIGTAVLHHHQLQRAHFVMAIGKSAQAYYSRRAPQKTVHLVPYGQDLSHHFAVKRISQPSRPVTFLFSGQLVERNNIRNLCGAIEKLSVTHSKQWKFVFGAKGPLRSEIDALLKSKTEISESISFDTEYATWLDRIRPFADSDLLVCPSTHAGWGLVVPEAMAAGMPVIATKYVNAADFLIENEKNGLLIMPDAESIHTAMAFFIDNPGCVSIFGEAAKIAAKSCDADQVAALMLSLFKRYWLKLRS
ncbi:MAG: glycosyltransferase family 4 protein [Myxococcales bacterium]|nr:MAG: glycosyltransferase family 4 protein [Myxococcales bacterium]